MSRELTKAVIKRALPQALEVLTSSTDEEVQACYPIIDVLQHALCRGQDAVAKEKLFLLKDVHLADEVPTSENARPQQPTEDHTLLAAMLAGAFTGSAETVDQALRSGADITASESSGRTVLHYCCTGGHASLLGKVLKKMQKVCREDRGSPREGAGGGGGGRFAAVLNQRDANGWSALAVAVCRCHLDCVNALLEYATSLDFAQLLEHSCPPSRGFERSRSNMLHLAAIQGHAPILTRLAEHIPLADNDSQQRNIFHYLAATKNADSGLAAVTSLLTVDRAALLLTKDAHKRTPLFCAAAYGNAEILMEFIRHLKQQQGEDFSLKCALMEETDSWTMSALQVAFLKRHYRVIDKIGTGWSVFRSPKLDEATFCEALSSVFGGGADSIVEAEQMAPQLLLRRVLENQSVWSAWLLNDLSASELTCYELLTAVVRFGTQAADQYALIRAIRRGGVELVYQSLTKCLQAPSHSTGGVSAREFLAEFKARLTACLPPLAAQAAWKYVNAETLVAARKTNPAAATAASPAAAKTQRAPARRATESPARQRSMPSAASKRVYAAWCDDNVPSFAAPTRTMRQNPPAPERPTAATGYESQRLR